MTLDDLLSNKYVMAAAILIASFGIAMAIALNTGMLSLEVMP